MRLRSAFLAGLGLLAICAMAQAQTPPSSSASAASAVQPLYQGKGMDWATDENNRPQPKPAGGGHFEPMDWSVLKPNEALRFEALTESELKRLLSSERRADLPNCVAAVFLDKPGSNRPFILHAYGRLGGGNGFVKINEAVRSAAAIPTGGDPGLFALAVQNFSPVSVFSEWKSSALTNPLPATLFLTVMSAERLPGSSQCLTGDGSCRRYRGKLELTWYQAEMSRQPIYDPSTGGFTSSKKPEDPPRQKAPASPRSLDVLIEDPCWGTRDGFVEAYANRSRLLELWHRWTN